MECSREHPHDAKLKSVTDTIFRRLPRVPNDLLPFILADVDPKQLRAIDMACHAHGGQIATEGIWRSMCLRDFNTSEKVSPDVTWSMTYESLRRAAALRREEEYLRDELEDLAEERKATKAGRLAKPTFVRAVTVKRPREPESILYLPPGSVPPEGATVITFSQFIRRI